MKTLRHAQGKQDVLIYFDLITSLKTTQEVADFVSEIDTFMQKKTLDSISTILAKKIRDTFSKNNLDINDQDAVAGFFTTLKGLLKKFKVIKLVLAFCPNYKMVTNIHNFVKEKIGVGYILDIEILDEVLGGAVVMFNGKYADFTLKKEIEETFTSKNAEILKYMQ